MKNNISKKQIILTITVFISLLIFITLTVTAGMMKNSLNDQRTAQRWAGGNEKFSQISCYFADTKPIDINNIMSFRSQIEKSLREAAYPVGDSSSRIYIDAYSAAGTINIRSNNSSMETAAMGVGGDFFMFHPLKLVTGFYFSGSDLMKDSIILDEEAAWNLFGSSDIIGMTVFIGNVPHYVRGVIERERGRLKEGAGLYKGVAYVSIESLKAYGFTSGINCYEAVIPNPVSGFAYRIAAENFGYTEDEMMVIDNTERFNLEALFRVIMDFGLRSMQSDTIRFPYWENYARGIEDILAVMLIAQGVFLLIPIIILVIVGVIAYRRKTWEWKGLVIRLSKSGFDGGKKLFLNFSNFIHKKIKIKRIIIKKK